MIALADRVRCLCAASDLQGELRATIVLAKLSTLFRGNAARSGFWTNGPDLDEAAGRLRLTCEEAITR